MATAVRKGTGRLTTIAVCKRRSRFVNGACLPTACNSSCLSAYRDVLVPAPSSSPPALALATPLRPSTPLGAGMSRQDHSWLSVYWDALALSLFSSPPALAIATPLRPSTALGASIFRQVCSCLLVYRDALVPSLIFSLPAVALLMPRRL